ncbi:MAG: hypothetical protein QM482_05340 [Sulfurospirillum sp.]
MDDFNILEEIGLKEVSNKTHIEVKNLEYMINSQFDKLSKTSTVGFVKILSREYKLDLTDWLNEAEKFWSENKEEDDGTKIFIVQKQKNFTKKLFAALSLFILAAILYGAYIFLNNKLNFFENPLVKTDTNYTYEQTPVVNEAKGTLEQNITRDENKTQVLVDINKSIGVEVNATSSIKIDETNNSVFNTGQELNISVVKKNRTDNFKAEKKDAYISPNAKLWVGVIYLDNFKRKSFLGKNNFVLDASRDQLVTTGHGNFTLYFNGEIKKFQSQNPIRLLIKNAEVSVITDKQFKALNRGSLW